MTNIEMVREWIKRDIKRYSNYEDFFREKVTESKIPGESPRHCIKFYSDNYEYSISVNENRPGGYLGCVVGTRKPRAGEDWSRGNDLPDGDCNEKTWQSIKNSILSYEMVRLESSKPVPESNGPSVEGPSIGD